MLKEPKESYQRINFNFFRAPDHSIISPFPEKVWVKTKCAEPGCKATGVALELPGQKNNHYCSKHNPRVKEGMKH